MGRQLGKEKIQERTEIIRSCIGKVTRRSMIKILPYTANVIYHTLHALGYEEDEKNYSSKSVGRSLRKHKLKHRNKL